MIKKLFQGVVVGTAMFGLAGAATAVERNINLYGASAQHLFWNVTAKDFLATKGCSSIARAQKDSRNGITRGLGCTSYGGDDVYIRYSSKASFDGVEAMKGKTTYTGTAEKCNEGDPGVAAGMAGYYRKMVDEVGCTWTIFPTNPGSCPNLKCVDVTLGASDVGGSAFTQSSSGNLNWNTSPSDPISRSFTGIDDSGLTAYQPLVVPFGFFVHKDVLKDGAPLENITRLMATQIFSGLAWSWKDFGGNFVSEPITVCLRHAGSGTHATLDYAVMKGNGWGWGLLETQQTADPVVFFNDGSSQMMSCIDQNPFAIGYADADQALSLPTNVRALKYQGEAPSRVNIRNGIYDFWATMWLYEDVNEPNYADTHPVVVDLMAFAADPANVPTPKVAWWATEAEMVYMKATDQEYPGWTLPTIPQFP